MNISADFKIYISSILNSKPALSPKAAREEWEECFQFLEEQRMAPLFYWKVASFGQDFLPPLETLESLRSSFMQSRLSSLQLEKQLYEIVEAFGARGVDLLVLKGESVARSVYPDPVTRPSDDLDLFVKPSQVEKAQFILESLGYLCEEKRFTDIYKNYYFEEKYRRQINSHCCRLVELHWDLNFSLRVTRNGKADDIFKRAIKVKIGNISFLALHHTDALLYSSNHLIRSHNKSMRLIWVYDIALLARSLSVPQDWLALQERTMEWGDLSSLEEAFKIVEDWLGPVIPPGFGDFSLWPKVADKKTGWVKELLKADKLNSSLGFCARVRFWTHFLFPSPGAMRRNFQVRHAWMLPAFYLWRWIKWGIGLLRAL